MGERKWGRDLSSGQSLEPGASGPQGDLQGVYEPCQLVLLPQSFQLAQNVFINGPSSHQRQHLPSHTVNLPRLRPIKPRDMAWGGCGIRNRRGYLTTLKPISLGLKMDLSRLRSLHTCRLKKPRDCNWKRTSTTSYSGALMPADSSSAAPDRSGLSASAWEWQKLSVRCSGVLNIAKICLAPSVFNYASSSCEAPSLVLEVTDWKVRYTTGK